MLDSTTKIDLIAYTRVSADRHERSQYSYGTQQNIISSCAHAHCAVPPGGFKCLTETGGARYRVPTAMHQLLHGPHNVVCVAWVSRFLRNMEIWNVLRPLFFQKGIQIWSAMDGFGSLTDPDKFNAAVQTAEDEITNHASRTKQVVPPALNPKTQPETNLSPNPDPTG
jgi:DNA invertase Pin-like site-specific DNA recombinase